MTDTANHRALLWTTLPNMKMDTPSIVVGQAGFTSNTANRGGCRSGHPVDADRFGTDHQPHARRRRGNHRVLLWNQHPRPRAKTADLVLGQSTGSGTNANAVGEPTASSLNTPNGVASDSTRVIVADSGNHRVPDLE